MEVESREEILMYMKTSYSRSAGSFQLPDRAGKLGQSSSVSLQPNSLLTGFPSFFWATAQPVNMEFVLMSLIQSFGDFRPYNPITLQFSWLATQMIQVWPFAKNLSIGFLYPWRCCPRLSMPLSFIRDKSNYQVLNGEKKQQSSVLRNDHLPVMKTMRQWILFFFS